MTDMSASEPSRAVYVCRRRRDVFQNMDRAGKRLACWRMRGSGRPSARDVVRAHVVALEWWDGIVGLKLGTETGFG